MADANTPRLVADGPIETVVVHGRGAIVTRKIVLDTNAPAAAFDLIVGGITAFAEPGSVRVQLPDGSRTLVGVNARLNIPATDDGGGESADRVDKLNRELAYLNRRESALVRRIERLRSVNALPIGGRSLREAGALTRLDQALALNGVVRDRLAALDTALLALRDEIKSTTEARDAAEVEDLQSSSSDRGDGVPTGELHLRIAAGDAPLRELTLSYAVPYAAKWWPQYTLRLTEGGTKASLLIEAIVAQRTGEDWNNVPIGFSTASIIFDATLPKLPSLRLGKTQPPEQRGFREPPVGLDQLFEAYDAFYGAPELPPPPPPPRPAPMPAPAAAPVMFAALVDAEELELPPPGAALPPPASVPMPAKKQSMGAVALRAGAPRDNAYEGSVYKEEATAPPTHDPGNEWLEFDMLTLAGAGSHARGQLRRRAAPAGLPESELFDAQDSARRQGLTDPSVSRGLFDYRYDSEGSCRVPADGRLHRVALREAQGKSSVFWKTVPLVDPAVYREVSLNNPHDFPLLAGPVAVFSEGQLATTTYIQRVDAGGTFRVGLGVDERIRVARNVRMVEESAGLLRGKRALTHTVSVELRSGLNAPISVELIDRVPVTNDDTVSVELERESHRGTTYEQTDLDQPVKGGRRWRVALDAGARDVVEFTYQISLRSKDELVGGNRRG